MGADGGFIPGRQDLVKSANKHEDSKRSLELQEKYSWSQCAFSGAELEWDDLASDWLGKLYSRSNLLEAMLKKETSLSFTNDVVTLKIDKFVAPNKWICPISGKQIEKGPASYIAQCGHVFSTSAIVQQTEILNKCPLCGVEYTMTDVIGINLADTAALQKRRQEYKAKGLTHGGRRVKKKKKEKTQKDKAGQTLVADGKVVKKTKA